MTEYDPRIIQEIADRLYRQADSLVAKWSWGMGVAGFFPAWIAGAASENGGAGFTGGLVLGAVLWLIGREIGEGKVFTSRLEAQQFLVRVQIEKNTSEIKALLLAAGRPSGTSPSGPRDL